jgi:flagellar basal-body rod modification protein FlgD
MAITSITNLTPTSPLDPNRPVGKKELDKNDFMTLFITQLQYQDPMKPVDSYQMASQMAQFSNVEATMKMSDNMEKLLDYQTSQNNLQLLNLIGKRVQTYGNQLAVNGGEASETEFSLKDTASSCTVQIYDAAGNLVRSLDKGSLAAGPYALAWDGKDQIGNQVEDGVYSYVVKALDMAGQEVETESRTTGMVTGLEFESGQAEVTVDKQVEVRTSDIVKVL